MENRETVVSDIERNKEVFEYEMTEVLLKLRGEFAAIRGEELAGENIGASAGKVDVDYNAPELAVSSPDNISTELPKLTEYKAVTVSSPHIEGIGMPEIPQFSGVPKKPGQAETPAQMLKRFEQTFDIPKADVSRYAIKRETDVKVECKSMPRLDMGGAGKHTLNNYTESVTQSIIAAMPKLKPELTGKTFAAGEFAVGTDKAPELPKAKISVGNLKATAKNTIPRAAAVEKHPIAKLPDVSASAVTKRIADTSALQVGNVDGLKGFAKAPSCDFAVYDAVLKSKTGGIDRSGIPVIGVDFPMPVMEAIKTSKAVPPELPKVPEKPDFSGYIADILGSLNG